MFYLLLLASPFLYSNGADWSTTETEIFGWLNKNTVSVNQAGETFLLDAKECRIVKIDPNGEVVLSFGAKGQGPGEWQYAMKIIAHGEMVYVKETIKNNIQCFDRQGNFKNTLNVGEKSSLLAKSVNGWIFFAKPMLSMPGTNDERVKWVDDDFKNEKLLFDFSVGKPKTDPKTMFKKSKSGEYIMPFNPAPDMMYLGSSQDGKRVIIGFPGTQMKLSILDGSNGEVLHTIAPKSDPLPFNKTWGEKQFEKVEESRAKSKVKSPFKMKSVPDFPDFFPFFRSVMIPGDDHIYVIPWLENPHDRGEMLTFNLDGEKVETDLDPTILYSTVHLNKTHGWVVVTSDEDEIGVARVPHSELASFVKSQDEARAQKNKDELD